ncbi:MAG TPA: type II toxin-antitoxin system prevent-host-death family antitoxin [Gemmatimonadaceae bacterium]|jgi:prevent-host-death family protein
MRKVSVHEARTNLSKLLEEVQAGERVVIARAGTPVAVLVPFRTAIRRRRLGLARGRIVIHADFDQLPPDITSAFGDEPS